VLWWVGWARFEPMSIVSDQAALEVAFAPIWQALYWPVLALSAAIIVVNAIKLALGQRPRFVRIADMALQGGLMAFVAWALGAPRWFTVTGGPAKAAASLELGLSLGVQVTLTVMLIGAAISLVYDGWRLWRGEPPAGRALNGA
jgi:hypothetical protein